MRTDKKKTTSKILKKATGERELFKSVWENRAHVSELSGHKLGEPVVSMFAHLLPKGLYPRFRLREDNIILLTPHEHYLLDFGTEEMREVYTEKYGCDWGVVYDKIEKLKIEYNER